MLLISLQLFHPFPPRPPGSHQLILLKDKNWGKSVVVSPDSLVRRKVAPALLSVVCVSSPASSLVPPAIFSSLNCKALGYELKIFSSFFSIVLWLYLETILPYLAWKCPHLSSIASKFCIILWNTLHMLKLFLMFSHILLALLWVYFPH